MSFVEKKKKREKETMKRNSSFFSLKVGTCFEYKKGGSN